MATGLGPPASGLRRNNTVTVILTRGGCMRSINVYSWQVSGGLGRLIQELKLGNSQDCLRKAMGGKRLYFCEYSMRARRR